MNDEDFRRLHELFNTGEFVTYVHTVYSFAISFCLLHEFGHYIHGDKFINPILEETNADTFATEKMLSPELKKYKRSAEFGMTAFFCCHLFFGIKQEKHPDIDDRLNKIVNTLKNRGVYNTKQDFFIATFVQILAKVKGYRDVNGIRNTCNLDSIFTYLKAIK